MSSILSKGPSVSSETISADAMNILGEVLWHSATSDSSIVQVSQTHMQDVLTYAAKYLPHCSRPRFLEVAAYAHITGYLLTRDHGWRATLSDISVETLALGARHAANLGLDPETVRRVAVDFHDLPFPDAAFDVVYISSALHHTLRWEVVLKQLMRVTAQGGILILQNEPCQREFCFYKFPTNRPDSFRAVETELDRLGILKTIAEPYPGSRPESLFGMIENQTMPLRDIVSLLESHGVIESLLLDSGICMSPLDHALLAVQRRPDALADRIRRELSERLTLPRRLLDDTDSALGMSLPDTAEIDALALKVAESIARLPAPSGRAYDIALASIFGGAATAVMRKTVFSVSAADTEALRYFGGYRKGVSIGFPPALTRVLELAKDLVPDVQTAPADEIADHFPAPSWVLGSNPDVRYLVLNAPEGAIVLRPLIVRGRFAVLLRAYAAPMAGAFRLRLQVNGQDIASVDVYQADSFLLRGELPALDTAPGLCLTVSSLDGRALATVPPVTVAAVRIVCIADEC
jgi:Methyltransferase domain